MVQRTRNERKPASSEYPCQAEEDCKKALTDQLKDQEEQIKKLCKALCDLIGERVMVMRMLLIALLSL